MTAGIAIGVCLNVSLVEESMEWFFAAYMTEVVQNFVPEACVQQVEHCVFNATHIQVDAAGMAFTLWAHPVALNLGVNESVGVGGVEITHLVPTRPCPLWHHVHFALVLAWSVAKVERDGGPFLHTCEWGTGIAISIVRVECCWFEVGKFWQQHRKRRLRNSVSVAMFVVHNGERFAPVALTREQPVAQAVGGGCFAVTVALQPHIHL